MIHTAVSRDSTCFNTGTTSQHPSWSHHHTLITFLSGCKKYSTKGLTMAWKAVKFKKRKIRWMSAHYRQNCQPPKFWPSLVILYWISTGWDGYRIKHLKESASWKTLANTTEAVDTLDDLDGLIALQGSCRISATTGILGRLNQWIEKGYLWK